MVKAVLSVLFLLLSVAALAVAQDGTGGTTNPGGPKCPKDSIVNCLVDPCSVTDCEASSQWECLANYCGGCKTDWRYKSTGLLLVNTACPPVFCPLFFKPVCGVDGKTYGNQCVATSRGIKIAYQGECKCSKTHKPVCGKDGVTYRNKCLALKNGTTVKYTGTCSFPKACAKANLIYKPVCGNGRTYANACVAKLNGVTDYTSGPCTGICTALCSRTSGCNAPNKCKGNPKYTCTNYFCGADHILDNGKYVKFGLCSGVYSNKATGYPAAACLP